MATTNFEKVSISNGNIKMGAIPSVSLPPIKTCAKDVPCASKCYAAKLCRIRSTVRDAYERNLTILCADPVAYWLQVRGAAAMTRFFRFHVSGDIPNADYFREMIRTAEILPGTNFLVFTKKYNIVNAFIAEGGTIPANLQVVFSGWGNMAVDNPYSLPESNVIFKGETPRPEWQICGGNCANCACAGTGCWSLKKGEIVAFYEH